MNIKSLAAAAAIIASVVVVGVTSADAHRVMPNDTTTTTSTTTTTPPDPCSWPAVRTNGAVCVWFNYTIGDCGQISGSAGHTLSNQPSWVYGVWFSTTPPSSPADGTPSLLTLPEGGVVYVWVAGTENDVLNGVPTFASPVTATVERCPDPTTTTQAPTTTTPQETTTTWAPTTTVSASTTPSPSPTPSTPTPPASTGPTPEPQPTASTPTPSSAPLQTLPVTR